MNALLIVAVLAGLARPSAAQESDDFGRALAAQRLERSVAAPARTDLIDAVQRYSGLLRDAVAPLDALLERLPGEQEYFRTAYPDREIREGLVDLEALLGREGQRDRIAAIADKARAAAGCMRQTTFPTGPAQARECYGDASEAFSDYDSVFRMAVDMRAESDKGADALKKRCGEQLLQRPAPKGSCDAHRRFLRTHRAIGEFGARVADAGPRIGLENRPALFRSHENRFERHDLELEQSGNAAWREAEKLRQIAAPTAAQARRMRQAEHAAAVFERAADLMDAGTKRLAKVREEKLHERAVSAVHFADAALKPVLAAYRLRGVADSGSSGGGPGGVTGLPQPPPTATILEVGDDVRSRRPARRNR